ncbi:MAG: hypothetical protein WBB28_06045 [Crinalium sp.]
MSKLGDSLVEQLISCSPKEKENMGTTIVELLSGDATKKAINLPARRGNADGGIDGRIRVTATSIEKISDLSGVFYKKGLRTEQEAAVSVKIEKKKFSPKAFGHFKVALERENIFMGIIITASGLSPDVERMIMDINNEGIYTFYHVYLKDIILWKVEQYGIEFLCGNISVRLCEELNKFIDNSST